MSFDVNSIYRDLERLRKGTPRRSRSFRSLRNRRSNPKKKLKTTIHKSWRWQIDEMPANKMSQGNEMFLGLSDIGDHITAKVIGERTERGLPTFVDDFSILTSKDQWFKHMQRYYDTHQVIQLSEKTGILVNRNNNTYIRYNIHSSTVGIELYGDKTTISVIGAEIREKFEEVLTQIEWIYSSDGGSIDIPLRADRQPVDEMYPFLKDELLNDYYDRFMDSPASILLLIGPPGTGKTSFIRGLMQHTQSSAVVTYDENILSKDYVFAQFIEGEQNVMVIEDADMFLKARSEGNSTMHKFLNIGDGLVTTKNKKLIFSTNLPSVKEIDPALIRPGRCFDVISFDYLKQEEAEALAKAVGVELTEQKDKWTIADVFHKQTFEAQINSNKSKMGFV